MKPETLKFIAGTSIVITAFGIMLPGVLGYAMRLANVAAVVAIAIGFSLCLVFVRQFLAKNRNTDQNGMPENSLFAKEENST